MIPILFIYLFVKHVGLISVFYYEHPSLGDNY
jgi:hypothetical protein